jgi:type II secretory pathway component PulF
MPKFVYKARDRQGQSISGELDADSAMLARRILSQQDLIPISVKSAAGFGNIIRAFQAIRNKAFPVPFEEVLVFNQQLQTAYSVGIPMVQAIQMIESQTKNARLKQALAISAEDVKKGKFLADAFKKHPDVFDRIYITLVRSGEQAGELDAFLERLSHLLERRADNKAKIKSATFYPKIVLGFLALVNGIFVFILLPKIKEFFIANGAELPPITRFVLAVSDFFIYQWPWVLLIAATLFFSFNYWVSTQWGRIQWDRIKLKTPVLGELFLMIDLNSLCFVTETLVKSGIPILETLSIVRTSVDNQVVAGELEKCQVEVQKGGKFSGGLARSKIFPNVFTSLVSMGEEAGKLEGVLAKVGAHYKREADYRLNNLSKLLEPILLFIIFVMVGILALAIMMPIWQLSRVMQGGAGYQ